tara:strand:+ start:1354 stop:1581 length:228 start_codon:yes stop_codon:yes gene_type:complete
MAATLEQAQAYLAALKHREYAYKTESDPMLMKFQLGKVTKEQWEAKRDEIKVRHPYPEDVSEEECISKLQDLGVL